MVTFSEVLAGILCTLLFVFVNLDTIGNFLNSLFGEEHGFAVEFQDNPL